MKKKLLILIGVLTYLTLSCSIKEKTIILKQVTIEDYEYFVNKNGYGSLTHKGNCKNPIHICN